MKDFTTISRIYFIGIGGIGMSALARYYLAKNASVCGYDKTTTALTKQMESDGIHIHYEDNVDELDQKAELIVYTPAVPKDHKELNYYLHNNYEVIKRSALLGGISVNYNTNFLGGDHKVSVVEADEYDRSFLQLSPDVALISAMDADHLDIYGTKENMELSFVEFSKKLKDGGLLLTNFNLPIRKFTATNHIRYSLQNNMADAFATNITLRNGGYEFD